jgi:hypothetical protein
MYKIEKDPSSGSYRFQTENGLIYLCRFRNCASDLSPVLGIYDIEIWEFDFICYIPEVQNGGFKKFDKKVSATISHLLVKYFANELRVILYVCDTVDGRHKERHKLFKNWFNNLYVQNDFTRIPMEVDLTNENTGLAASAHGCVITRKDFPHMEVLQRELIDKAASIIGQKIGMHQST